jgi:hypothetical protein
MADGFSSIKDFAAGILRMPEHLLADVVFDFVQNPLPILSARAFQFDRSFR